MSNVPLARQRLEKMALELQETIELLHREKPVRQKTPTKSRKLTPELARRIRRYAHAHPDLSNQEVAVYFHVNAGRVTDAVQGKKQTS